MFRSRLHGALCASFCLLNLCLSPAHAIGTWETTLLARDLDGNLSTAEAYYDTVLNITWLADANYAGTPMDWATANSWAAALDPYGSGINGWRLPTMMDTGTPGCNDSNSGTDCGYNVQTTSGSPPYPAATVYSEMASMFYDTLGNKAYFDTSGASPQPGWGFSNAGPFDNVQSDPDDYYWTGLEYAPDTNNAWLITFHAGKQTHFIKSGDPSFPTYAWAVHPGDIGTAVPLPAAVWLFGGGLLGLIGAGRRRRR
jgi:hypothetical protein